MQSTLEELLRRRFNHFSDDIRARLKACSLAQLRELVNPALDTPDLDAFLAAIPEADAQTEASSTDSKD